MTADEAQLRHHVPQALAKRLKAIRLGSRDWHIWHQAGVLLSELAESARRISYRGSGRDVDSLITAAMSFMARAHMLLGDNDVVNVCAISCDEGLALARMMTSTYTDNESPRATLQSIISVLEQEVQTPAVQHQLAIAHGFLARTHWIAWHVTGTGGHIDGAWTHEKAATDLFNGLDDESPDTQRAFASHMIAMALMHSAYGARLTQWQRCWRAFWLAGASRDRKQQLRAVVVGLLGNTGERWLRRRRDSPKTIRAALYDAQTAQL